MVSALGSTACAFSHDQMTGRRHRSNVELVAQGIANIASTAGGGLPATGAIARTATNIRSGARSPVAGMAHAGFLLIFMLALAPVMKFVPLAALAAILVVVAINMAEIHRFRVILNTSLGDRAVLLATFGLTVLVDLTLAIEVGMVLAAFVFMHRMAKLTSVEGGRPLIEGDQDDFGRREARYEPERGDTSVITFRGPLFFGSASTLKDTLDQIGEKKKHYVLRLDEVPMIDPTGAFALGSFIRQLRADGATVTLAGASAYVTEQLRRSIEPGILDGVDFA